VLLVDDDPVTREVVLIWLTEAGLQVDVAASGGEAVEQARDQGYALVLIELQMPGLDGVAATRAIRALRGCATIPIIAMTADVFELDRERCLEAGVNDHLLKPVDPERLFAVALKWLAPAAAKPG